MPKVAAVSLPLVYMYIGSELSADFDVCPSFSCFLEPKSIVVYGGVSPPPNINEIVTFKAPTHAWRLPPLVTSPHTNGTKKSGITADYDRGWSVCY